MSAYVVVDVDVLDQASYDRYRAQVPETLARYSGRFVVRGGDPETLEGDRRPKRVVILEFPDRQAAKAWWASTEYAAPKALRQKSARTEMIVVDGL